MTGGGNFSLDGLEDRVAGALDACRDYVADRLGAYEDRCVWRRQRGVRVLALCGYNRCGKDTAAAYLGRLGPAVYAGSSSSAAMPILARVLGVSVAEATAARQDHLDFWIAAFHELRRHDLMFTLKLSLGQGDYAVGIRGAVELDGAIAAGVVYRSAWIYNYRAGPNPTVEYGPADCDLGLPNHGSLLEFYACLRRFAALLTR